MFKRKKHKSGVRPSILSKIQFVLKDNQALSYAPIILMGAILIGVVILQFLTFSITKGNAMLLKQEVLNETSYLNSSMASAIYDDISSGTYADFKSVVNGRQVKNTINQWKEDNLQGKLNIVENTALNSYTGEYNKARVGCSKAEVVITDINETTKTVTYAVKLYDTVYRSDISGDKNHLGDIVIYGSYTYNGEEDVEENKGNVAFENDAVNKTEPEKDGVEGKLPELPENPDIGVVG